MSPLHQRIRDDIRRHIMSGAWPPGHRVPAEHELMADYGCARMTVSKALAGLAEAGLIVRRRRAGSFVANPRVHSAVLAIPDIRADIEARGQAYAIDLIDQRRRPADPALPDETQLAGGGDLLALICLHRADGRPFALERRLIALAAVPQAADADLQGESPGGWLLAHVSWTEAEHRILAVGADAETARLLALAPGAPCLVLERRTWRGETHITQVRQIFPGDSFDLVARFTPHTGH